jgi:hypothetical protein
MKAEKPRKALRSACKAIGIPFKNGYASAGGQVQKSFFRDLADAVGMDRSHYTRLDKVALASAILEYFDIPFDDSMESAGSRITDKWFDAVIPKLNEFAGKDSYGIPAKYVPAIFMEGDSRISEHYTIERNRDIVSQLKDRCKDRSGLGFIACHSCRVAPGDAHAVEIIEAHHLVPVSVAGFREVKFEDFILLCPNCHRALHAGAKLQR